jgi:hypothetical protein
MFLRLALQILTKLRIYRAFASRYVTNGTVASRTCTEPA